MSKKKIIIIIGVVLIVIVLTIILLLVLNNSNNWKDKFELLNIEGPSLDQEYAKIYSISGKIKNISKEQYKNVRIIIEFTTHKGELIEDEIYIGNLTYNETDKWISKSISHWSYKIKEVLYEKN